MYKKNRSNKKDDEEVNTPSVTLPKLSVVRCSNRTTQIMDNDMDESDMNDPGSLSMEISKENKELEVHPVEENNTPTFIHAHQENTTDDRNVNLETPSIQPIEDMIESMFNQSNTKEYQKKLRDLFLMNFFKR